MRRWPSQEPPAYLLLTDADIVHAPDSVSRLVAHAEDKHLVLASLMVKLRCESFAEHSNIPAFIFFFQMLYPFAWVNRPRSAVAAAAGGCMLVRADVLRQAGGIEVIRGALIDDCALAKALKVARSDLARIDRPRAQHPSLSGIRGYPPHGGALRLCATALLAVLLLGTVAGMVLTYLVPPFVAVFGSGTARGIGIGTWALMAVVFQPTLRLYRLSPLWGFALPAIASANTCSSPSIPPTNMCEDGAELGRGACKPTCQNRDDHSCRSALGQGPSGRKLSRGVAADSSAPSRADPRILRICPHRGRYRGPRRAGAAGQACAARPARGGTAWPQRRRCGRCRLALRNSLRATCHRAMRKICSPRSGWT